MENVTGLKRITEDMDAVRSTEFPKSKSQFPNKIQISISKLRTFSGFGHWNFGIVWLLVLGTWNFRAAHGVVEERSYLH